MSTRYQRITMFSMFPLITVILLLVIEICSACLPTQTVVTTTTTVAPYPCSVCPPIYGQGCLGTGATDFCATVAEVGLTYTLGILTGYNYGDSNTCSTIFSCPIGTTSKVRLPIINTIVPGPSLVIATCQETGANAGTWYYGIPPLTTPVEIVATSCVGILSG